MDVAIDGDPQAQARLIVSSACHGAEGFAGSGVQVGALLDADLRDEARRNGVAVVHLHALNPYGFSHLSRTTHENVDLNRNFLDFSGPLPVNEPLSPRPSLLVPDRWPPPAETEAALMEIMQSEGTRALQAVVTRGQYEFVDGLFFGGAEPSWSNLTLRQVLREVGSHAPAARLDRLAHRARSSRFRRAHPWLRAGRSGGPRQGVVGRGHVRP
jgi:hypothetical protein